MSPRERRAGPSLHMGIHQGQELVCEVVLSDVATQFEERFALATNYRDYVGRNSPRANIEMRRYEEFLKSPLHVKEDYVLYPAECCEQRYKDELDEMLVTSPLYEDKTQVEEFYKDVRFPSSLQSRPPSMTSSLSAAATHAHKTPATSSVCTHSATAAQILKSSQSCVSIKTSTPPPY